MGRLKLFGEPEGGGTDDHSALSNLDYAQSGHSGFVPSQGEALIDILRLNQNLIRDSEGTDRITLSPASPHLTLSGQVRITDVAAIGGYAPSSLRLLTVMPVGMVDTNILVAIFGAPIARIPSGGITGSLHALNYQIGAGGGGVGTVLPEVTCVYVRPQIINYVGTVTDVFGLYARTPAVMAGNPSIPTYTAAEFQGVASSAFVDVYGVKIGDSTVNTGFTRLLEVGPATPYLRLVGGGDPPANKSNLYLKFGSTLYRVIKSGSYMTLEAA